VNIEAIWLDAASGDLRAVDWLTMTRLVEGQWY